MVAKNEWSKMLGKNPHTQSNVDGNRHHKKKHNNIIYAVKHLFHASMRIHKEPQQLYSLYQITIQQ